MKPYLMHSEIAHIAHQLPLHLMNAGNEIRVLMPRFGTINERRHRLHEVVRLSGMNIIIDDDDYPLIIKVASLPGARLQVYFLDNEEFFKRKFEFTDEKKRPFEDNAERMIFFCKGALETVKKWGWPPDIIHCHGWMTSLIPLYIKTVYKREPVFQNAKVVYSVYSQKFDGVLSKSFHKKARIHQNISEGDFAPYEGADCIALNKGAIMHADATIVGEKDLDRELKTFIKSTRKPLLEFVNGDQFVHAYQEFYKTLMKR